MFARDVRRTNLFDLTGVWTDFCSRVPVLTKQYIQASLVAAQRASRCLRKIFCSQWTLLFTCTALLLNNYFQPMALCGIRESRYGFAPYSSPVVLMSDPSSIEFTNGSAVNLRSGYFMFLCDAELKQAQEVFDAADVDGSGLLERSEIWPLRLRLTEGLGLDLIDEEEGVVRDAEGKITREGLADFWQYHATGPTPQGFVGVCASTQGVDGPDLDQAAYHHIHRLRTLWVSTDEIILVSRPGWRLPYAGLPLCLEDWPLLEGGDWHLILEVTLLLALGTSLGVHDHVEMLSGLLEPRRAWLLACVPPGWTRDAMTQAFTHKGLFGLGRVTANVAISLWLLLLWVILLPDVILAEWTGVCGVLLQEIALMFLFSRWGFEEFLRRLEYLLTSGVDLRMGIRSLWIAYGQSAIHLIRCPLCRTVCDTAQCVKGVTGVERAPNCCICLEHKSTVCLQCGHLCVCPGCYSDLVKRARAGRVFRGRSTREMLLMLQSRGLGTPRDASFAAGAAAAMAPPPPDGQ